MSLISCFPGGSKKPCIPQYTGACKITFLDDGHSGYIEMFSTGELTWLNDKPPEHADLFGVGGGGGSTSGFVSGTYYGGSPGGGGYTSKALNAVLPQSLTVTIGAGGAAGTGAGNNETPAGDGGTTSIGALLSAQGGKGATWNQAGNGGSGGAGATAATVATVGAVGGTNGSDGQTQAGNTLCKAGIGQGTPTTDLLGRKHAGGGSAGNVKTTTAVPGGASDFASGAGGSDRGGGGYGGGAGGKNQTTSTSNTIGDVGGDGFAMIAWGNYNGGVS